MNQELIKIVKSEIDWQFSRVHNLRPEAYEDSKRIIAEGVIPIIAEEIIKDIKSYAFAEPQYIPQSGREPVLVCLTETYIKELEEQYRVGK